MDRSSLELLLGQGLSIEKIAKRFAKHPSTVSYWMAKYGLQAVNRAKHAARGGIQRDRLEEMVESGMTIAELATELGVSKTTVRHWMRRYGIRTKNKRGPRHGAKTRQAKAVGLAQVTFTCPHHGKRNSCWRVGATTDASAAALPGSHGIGEGSRRSRSPKRVGAAAYAVTTAPRARSSFTTLSLMRSGSESARLD